MSRARGYHFRIASCASSLLPAYARTVLRHPAEDVEAEVEMELLFGEHQRHGPRKRPVRALLERPQLVDADPVDEAGERTDVAPAVELHVERLELVVTLLGGEELVDELLALLAEVPEDAARLQPVPGLVGDDPGLDPPVLQGRGLVEPRSVLLDGGELRVRLDDHQLDDQLAHRPRGSPRRSRTSARRSRRPRGSPGRARWCRRPSGTSSVTARWAEGSEGSSIVRFPRSGGGQCPLKTACASQ